MFTQGNSRTLQTKVKQCRKIGGRYVVKTLERFSDQGENTLRIKHAVKRTTIVRSVSLHAVTRRSYRTSLMQNTPVYSSCTSQPTMVTPPRATTASRSWLSQQPSTQVGQETGSRSCQKSQRSGDFFIKLCPDFVNRLLSGHRLKL